MLYRKGILCRGAHCLIIVLVIEILLPLINELYTLMRAMYVSYAALIVIQLINVSESLNGVDHKELILKS